MYPHNMAAGFSIQESEAGYSLENPIPSPLSYSVGCPIECGRGLYKDLTNRRWGFLGTVEAVHTSLQENLQKYELHTLRFPCLPELLKSS